MRTDFWRHFDFLLLGAVILANAFGVAMIRSAVAGNEVLIGLVNRQIIFASLGLGLIIIFSIVDYHYWGAIIRPIYLATMLFLVVLYFVGAVRFGAARWIETGLVSIQPTEIAKIVVILALAYYFERTKDSPRSLRWVLFSGLIAGGLALWIFLQPNLSNVIVILVIWASMIFINGVKLQHVAIFGAVAAALVAIAIFAPFSPLQEYQRQRVFTFFSPDPNARHGATYNVEQALIAIGSGGLTGEGYSHGTQTQLRFLKVRHTDFIFSAASEEFGFVGIILLLLLLGFIVFRIFRASALARDHFGSMICFGVGILIFFQGAVNIAVNLNLIPVTGLPLPFISYGGSGLVALMAGIGLVESVILRHKPLEF